MSRAANPFSPGRIAGVLLAGSAAFLLMLYAIGAGWDGDDSQFSTAHARSNALNGFAGIAQLLEESGYTVETSHDHPDFDFELSLLVLTPGTNTDPDEIDRVIEARRYSGPTILVLPKWMSRPLPDNAPDGTPEDWVQLGPGFTEMWLAQVESLSGLTFGSGQTNGWTGRGLQGTLPNPAFVQGFKGNASKRLVPLVTDSEGDILAGYIGDGYLPGLEAIANGPAAPISDTDDYSYPLVVVAEPDLMNNSGMADRSRAMMSAAIIEAAMDGDTMPVVFDMTMPGFGSAQNLLTLAFRPPFLAATLCLLLLLAVIGWRAFRRFGPPAAPEPALARGKTQLARNGASLIERTRRWHLLAAPYAALVAQRIAAAHNIREVDETAREAAIDAVMTHHGHSGPRFSERARDLRAARRPAEMIRAASALRTIERTLKR